MNEPVIKDCPQCKKKHGFFGPYISRDCYRKLFWIQCRCGLGTSISTTEPDAIEKWNTLKYFLVHDESETPTQQE